MRIYREFIKSTESRESPEYSQFRVSRNFRKPRESRSFSRHSVIRWSIGGTLIDFYIFFYLIRSYFGGLKEYGDFRKPTQFRN